MSKLTFHGHSCFTIEANDGTTLVIDPFLTGNPIADNGTLVYVGSDSNIESELVWVTREALPEPTAEWIPSALELSATSDWYQEMHWD